MDISVEKAYIFESYSLLKIISSFKSIPKNTCGCPGYESLHEFVNGMEGREFHNNLSVKRYTLVSPVSLCDGFIENLVYDKGKVLSGRLCFPKQIQRSMVLLYLIFLTSIKQFIFGMNTFTASFLTN